MEDYLKIKPLTPKEVADCLKVDDHTVIRWAREGEIPGYKFKGAWRFDQKELAEWVKSKKR